MRHRSNNAGVVLLSLAILAGVDAWVVLAAPEQPASKERPDTEPNDALRLIPHRRAKKSLEAAADLIVQKEWAEAARILQTLLDMKEDGFIPVQRPQSEGEAALQWTSVRAEVHRLLRGMPR